jgi:hypothetical protein
MKKFILTLGLAAGLSALTYGQNGHGAGDGHNHGTPAPATQAATSQADIKMEKLVHDYGNIQQGADGNCEFKFVNNGKEPLVITNCQGSCGCTVPECPTAPILPGKSSVIKVKYDTNRPGPIYKTVTVTSNAKSGNVVLTIKGNVEVKPVEETFPQNQTPAGAPVEKKG